MKYCLIDGSKFYASASTIMRPDLRDKPVLVASGVDGIAIAASRACKEKNISNFAPIFQVKDKVAMHSGGIFRANFNTLGHLSARMMRSILDNYGEDLPHFQYSVDELFLSCEELHTLGVDLNQHIYNVRRRVYQETRIGTGAGVGRTLTLAKVGSFAAKKLPGYDGQCVLENIKHEDEVLKLMPTSEIWNIGRKLTEHLKFKGITTAYQLKNQSAKKLQKEFSINVANVVHELNGVAVLNFSDKQPPKKQVFSTSSNRDRFRCSDALFSKLADHAFEMCKKVRAQNSEIKALSVFISTSRYDRCKPYSNGFEIQFDSPTCDTSVILNTIRSHFDSLLPHSLHQQPIYKVAVGATRLVDSEMRQFDLFQQTHDNVKLMSTVDTMNLRFGKGSLKYASQSTSNRVHNQNIQLLELPNYLTDINQLVEIKCC